MACSDASARRPRAGMDATETGSDPPPQSTSARTELPAPVKMNAWAETSRTSSTSAYSLEERCCFVCCCEIKGVLVCPCECNARFMHIECQLKMMKHTVAHREGCPVCQSKYRNVHTSRTQVHRLTRDGRFLLLPLPWHLLHRSRRLPLHNCLRCAASDALRHLEHSRPHVFGRQGGRRACHADDCHFRATPMKSSALTLRAVCSVSLGLPPFHCVSTRQLRATCSSDAPCSSSRGLVVRGTRYGTPQASSYVREALHEACSLWPHGIT